MATRRSFRAEDEFALLRAKEAVQFSRKLLQEGRPSTFLGRQHYPVMKGENVCATHTPERDRFSGVAKTGDIAGMVPLPEVDGSPVRILLVEDEFFIRMDVADAFRQAGFHVVEAGSADEAEKFIQSGLAVDLIFTDINLPGELNGLTLAEKIRSKFPIMPVLIGSGDLQRESKASRLGKFIPKPYDVRHLVKLVEDILGSSRSEEWK